MSADRETLVRPDGEKPTTCLFDERRVLRPCWPLAESLEAPYGAGVRSRGLILNSMTKLKSPFEFARNMVSLRSGDNCGKDRKLGFEINYCPFCGAAMNEMTEAYERGEETE